MITGYNTDVEHGGVVYHVQTEDKGLQSPLILTLVYVGGAILASKRTSYRDLIEIGFVESILVERLQRQHKLICAAVNAGRIEDLKRLGERDAAAAAAPKPERTVEPDEEQAPDQELETEPDQLIATQPGAQIKTEPEPSAHAETPLEPAPPTMDAASGEDPFSIRLLGEPDLRGGQIATLQFFVSRAGEQGRVAVASANVRIKVLGSTFSPKFTTATTNPEGIAIVSITLPGFTSGRAAVLAQVESQGAVAELRCLILPSTT